VGFRTIGELPARFPTTAAGTAAAATAAVSTATATATTAASTEATATTTTEAATSGLGSRFVDGEGAAAELRLVQFIDGALGVVVARHLDEREATCTAGRHVAHDPDGIHWADFPEHLFELGFSRFVREVTHKQPATHVLTFRMHDWCTLLPPQRERGSRELARVALPLQLL
jgi:hypothetical protein